MGRSLDMLEPFKIRARFYTETVSETQYGNPLVRVFDKELSSTDPIYEYKRNYPLLKSFEPFRLWDEDSDKWRYFAAISPNYMSFEILDLESHEVIAKNPDTLITKEQAESLNRIFSSRDYNFEEGQVYNANNFCIAGFHVPDFFDIWGDSPKEMNGFKKRSEGGDYEFWQENVDNFLAKRTFGYISGCHWGDDWSYKVQAFDLAPILEGKVANDERFGYFVLSGELKDLYEEGYYEGDSRYLTLNTPIAFDMNDDGSVKGTTTFSHLPNFNPES